MPNPIEPRTWPSPRGPWPEVTDDRIFDTGSPWCVNAAGHPGYHDDYPNRQRHFPPYECRTRGLYVDAHDGLDGPTCDLDIYVARSYQFGELREEAKPPQTRVVFDLYNETNNSSTRYSVSLGDAARIAMHLLGQIRSIDNPRRA